MISALKKALNSIGAKTEKINDVWQNDEILYDIFCELGFFQISTDNYGSIFILSDDNQIIEGIEVALLNSGNFTQDDINSSDNC
jgi:hypothetical protein